jgi:hypothetical protein
MKAGILVLAGGLLTSACTAWPQSGNLLLPQTVEAGSSFSVQTTGSGKATLLIAGLGQVLKRDVELGETTTFPVGSLRKAGHYVAILTTNGATYSGSINVVPSSTVAALTFLAKPSRLPVGSHGITGTVFVFDAYRNLITSPTPVSFELSYPGRPAQRLSVLTRNGAAWITMDSSTQAGRDSFVARAGNISSTRVIAQVSGDPCRIKMSATPSGKRVSVATEPVQDCNGNPVPDGTIVTFTESYEGSRSTVDVPLKRGVAKSDMPAHPGATITVASGVVLGNEVRLEK